MTTEETTVSDEAELSTQNQAWNKQQKAIQSQKSMRLTQPLYLGSDNQLDLARERADFLEAEVRRLQDGIIRVAVDLESVASEAAEASDPDDQAVHARHFVAATRARHLRALIGDDDEPDR